jgi:hypothetical protein
MKLVQQFHLADRPDEIKWRFSANGNYSSQLTYQVQFSGSVADYEWARLWSTKAENKCKMFCWLILQNKLWTADRVLKHGGHANQICQLCRTQSQRCTYRLSAPTQTQCGVGLPNGSEHSCRLRQQTATGEVVDIHDGGGAKSPGHNTSRNV